MTAVPSASTLRGRRVLVTRERPGELGRLLADRGAEVVHVPLIAVIDAPDGGRALRTRLDDLESFDWLIVTSAAGAERVGAAARHHPAVALAAVGTGTARHLAALAGRPVDLVPSPQLAEALAAELNRRCLPPQRILVAQADRAADTLVAALRAGGHEVTVVVAYSTVLVAPDLDRIDDVDALLLASGSAAQSWVAAVGPTGPRLIVAIGPTTAAQARRFGLKVDAIAADHSLVGLVDELERRITSSSGETPR